MRVLLASLTLAAVLATGLASTPSECTAAYNQVQQIANVNQCFSGATTGSISASSTPTTQQCQAAVDAIRQAVPTHLDCQMVRYVIGFIQMATLTDGSGNSCGGLNGMNTVLSSVMTMATNAMVPGTPAPSTADLDATCQNTCYEQVTTVLQFAFTGSDSSSDAMFTLMGKYKKLVCTKKNNQYCLGQTKAALAILGGEGGPMGVSADSLNGGLCSDDPCAKAGYMAYADILEASINIGTGTNSSDQQSMIGFFKAFPRFVCTKTPNNKFCFVEMNSYPNPPNGGACETGGRTSDACAAHLQTFESLGCCVNTILDMFSIVPGETATLAADSRQLFQENSITLPAACSKNAFKMQVQVSASVDGTLTDAECTSVGQAVNQDTAESAVAGDMDRISSNPNIACTVARRRLSTNRRWLSGTTTNVAVTTELYSGSEQEAQSIQSTVSSGVSLDATATAAATAGVPLASSSASAAVTQEVASNPDATGTVVVPEDDSSAITTTPSFAALLLALVAVAAVRH